MCAGGGPLSTTTDSSGSWQVTISGQTPPCAVEVSGGTINGIANTIPYHSIATSFGTVNVTPLSDLMLAYLLSEATPNIWFARLAPATLVLITPATVNAALTTQCTALSGLTPLCTTNPITTVFTPTSNNIMEYMLIALQVAILNTGVTYSELLSGAAMPTYTFPVVGFDTALTNSYIAATSPIISANAANTTAQNLTVGTAMPGFSLLSAMGGAIPYVYSITSGTLPAGLSFNASTGAVTGTPLATYATANLVFSVSDANNVVASTTSTVSFTVSPASSSGSGTITLTNAPASTGGTFVPNNVGTGGGQLVFWTESSPPTSNVSHLESIDLRYSPTDGSISSISFHSQDLNISNGSLVSFDWVCGSGVDSGVDCSGVTLDLTAGTLTFSNTVIPGVATLSDSVAPPAITLNGTLTFTPF